jgi:Domain of unknown function (DUF4352)
MRKLLVLILLGAVILVMLAAGAVIIFDPEGRADAEPLPIGQAVRMDDFAFTALASERASSIGTQTAPGIFYIVSLRVENRAKVVPFQFKPENAVLIDAAGQQYLPDAAARSAWFIANHTSDACAAQLPAGTNCTTTLVYAVPAETQAPILKISFGGDVGSFVNSIEYGKQVIQLK